MDKKKWIPLVVALSIAVVAAGWYMLSGKSSLDLNTRELQQKGNIETVEASTTQNGPENTTNTLTIKCKNGESYEIVFTQDHQNYDDFVFDACGDDGEAVAPDTGL